MPPNLRLYLQMQVCAWTVFSLLISGTWFLKYTTRPTCAGCPGLRERRCSDVWKAVSLSIDVSAKECRSSPIVAKDVHALDKKMGVFLDFEGKKKAHQICSFMWADNFWTLSHPKSNLEQMLRDLIENPGKVGLSTWTCESLVDRCFVVRREM